MSLITRLVEYAREIRSQSLDVRLHSPAGAPLRPEQPFGELRRPRPLALGPDDQRLA